MIDNDTSPGTGGFGEILVSSRSLREYQAMFALTDHDLERRILDCPGGAAGFAAEVSRRGGDVTACDIAYFDSGIDRVAATAVAEADRGNRYVREHADAYRWTFFADPGNTIAPVASRPSTSPPTLEHSRTATSQAGCPHCRSPTTPSIWS
ncbi:hypothetical protein [Nocardia alba]|uniref:hypothetical protein n=1 Tax=Nocardia alba TaxID=225051 RepID=UPI000A4F6CAF|nr:hypothetical protein [Nocardia alba]